MAAKKIALFIDADNISAKFGKQIIDTLESRGEIFIRRIYGNWEKISLHGWNECILNFSLRAVQQPDFAAGKNATDMSLTIDAMDVLYAGHANIFALVSNDSDFTPLVIRLREGGMNVIGMGNDNASLSFRNACNEFIDLDNTIEPLKPAPPPVKPSTPKVMTQSERNKKLQQIHNILHEVAQAHCDAKGFFLLNSAGLEIKNKNLGFGVKDFGYGTLQEFMAAFPKLYEVKKVGNVVYYRCLTSEPKPKSSNDKLQQIHNVLRETVKAYGNEKGFTNLGNAGTALASKNLSIKSLEYSTLKSFVTAFPNLYEVKDNFYRCLTSSLRSSYNLQQIHDVLREVAKTYKDLNDDGGFTDLTRAGQRAKEKNISIQSFNYSSWSRFVSNFPKLYDVKSVGSVVYYRCL